MGGSGGFLDRQTLEEASGELEKGAVGGGGNWMGKGNSR
jgi:hypothetical protein